MKKWIIIAVTVCLVVSLIAFIKATDIDKVIGSVYRVGYHFVWLLLVTGAAYYFATISWRYCLGDQSQSVSTIRLFLIRHVGETVSLFNPASVVGGDSVKAILLGNYGIEKKKVIASVILSRLILVVSQLSLFMMTVLVILVQNPGFRCTSVQEKVAGWYPFILIKSWSIRSKIESFREVLQPFFKHKRKMLGWSLLFGMLHWISGALEFYFILKFLGMEVSILQALLIDLGVVFFKAAGAFIPGQIGVEEYGNKVMLTAIGIPNAEIWISASILRRARQLVWVVFGIVAYFLLYNKHNLFHKE